MTNQQNLQMEEEEQTTGVGSGGGGWMDGVGFKVFGSLEGRT